MAKSKQYLNLEDILDVGIHTIELKPKEEWSETEQRFIKGTHKTGEVKKGKNIGKVFWMYTSNVPYLALDENGEQLKNNDGSAKQRYCGAIAFSPQDKKLFDEGRVKVEVKKLEWYNSVESPGKKFYSLADIEAEGETPLVIGKEPYKFEKIVANIKPMSYVPRMTSANTSTGVSNLKTIDSNEIPEPDGEEIDTKDIPF
jgi:hypothetical protein